MKIPNKPELEKIASHNSLDINFKEFMNIYRKFAAKPYTFWVIEGTLALDNPLCFRKNLRKSIKTNHDNWW